MTTPNREFTELEQFRHTAEESGIDIHHQPYHRKKKQVLTYRAIFLGLGILFLILTLIVIFMTHQLPWLEHVWTLSFTTTKSFVAFVGIILTLFSLWLAYSLRTEKEAAIHIFHKASHKLTQIYAQKHLKADLTRFSWFGSSYTRFNALKQEYRMAQRELEEQKDQTLFLLGHINNNDAISLEQKEQLFNQALLELKDKLQGVLRKFKNGS